jgi:deoxyguanosine kinase
VTAPAARKDGFIAVEGVIGVGKTTLARLLSETLNARLLLEIVEENPFLKDFYRDMRRYAFQTQVFFLLSRYQQQMDLTQPDLFTPRVVSDYIFQKDRIFANLNLTDSELSLYDRLFPLLERDVPTPDLVIYLQASHEVVMDRIARRGREYERAMPSEYIAALNEAYNYFFFHYVSAPLLIVNTNTTDFVNDPTAVTDLLKRVEEHAGGTVYYTPLAGGNP